MKYICLAYVEEEGWNALSESQRNAALDEAFAYRDELRASGHLLAAEELQNARNAATLRAQDEPCSGAHGMTERQKAHGKSSLYE